MSFMRVDILVRIQHKNLHVNRNRESQNSLAWSYRWPDFIYTLDQNVSVSDPGHIHGDNGVMGTGSHWDYTLPVAVVDLRL